ncbi:MAG: RNA methyltransferase [Dysgonamonadaceae bacterium]|jgi:TrmH family RNA methyltransferase|nr:RNA methyltransferase [Dysgonamonadaceae bacterium]
MEKIVSLQNSRIKQIGKLQTKARERKNANLFVIEGAREISLALEGGYLFESVFVCPELSSRSDYPALLKQIPEQIQFEVSEAVFEKIAYREGSDGLLALTRPESHHLSDLKLPSNPFIIILEAVEKPGNLGAILRTADASQANAVIVCDPLTDIYNPNVVRSSVGCLFTVPIAVCSNEEALEFMKCRNIKTFAAELNAAQWYHETDFTTPSAIIMGTEADGLTDFWLKKANARIKIPMRGIIDSLNVSVSTAVITFEAMRQRGFSST